MSSPFRHHDVQTGNPLKLGIHWPHGLTLIFMGSQDISSAATSRSSPNDFDAYSYHTENPMKNLARRDELARSELPEAEMLKTWGVTVVHTSLN